MKPRRLTDKQERFAVEFATNGGNATAAYRAAYDAGGMAPHIVNQQACRIAANPRVAARIAELRQAARDHVERVVNVTATDVALSAQRAMLADLAQALDASGHPLPFEQWPEDLRLATDSVQFETTHVGEGEKAVQTRVTKVKLSSRATARDQLAKHLGWYEADNAQRRPHESMTDEQLRAALREELEAARTLEGTLPPELPATPGKVH